MFCGNAFNLLELRKIAVAELEAPSQSSEFVY